MLLKTVKRLRVPYREKEWPYPLVIILGDLIFYKNRVIYIKIKIIKSIVILNTYTDGI